MKQILITIYFYFFLFSSAVIATIFVPPESDKLFNIILIGTFIVFAPCYIDLIVSSIKSLIKSKKIN